MPAATGKPTFSQVGSRHGPTNNYKSLSAHVNGEGTGMDVHILPQVIHDWAFVGLAWIGFGTLVGLAAKLIMPGHNQGGPLATVILGAIGTAVGCGLLALAAGMKVSPLSLWGFLAATAGAFLLLFVHRLLNGAFFREEGTGMPVKLPHQRKAVYVTKQ
jgi:uncharacterized membrane protein YeaQ/YmgE (transglycosylase-associated protein family)